MKQIKHILLTFALLLSSLATSARDFEVCDVYYNITSAEDLTVAVTYGGWSYDYAGYSGAVTIPAIVIYNDQEYRVTSIGERAFFNCMDLTSITIPASVTNIGDNAFENCHNLTEVHISDIEAWCKIQYPNNVYSSPLFYAGNLFFNGELVTELALPEGLTSIEAFDFSWCTSLRSIILPASVTSIGERAFESCTCLISITIPDGVMSIGDDAFYDCSSLTTINIPESVTSIGQGAFFHCASLTSVVLPKELISINDYTFSNCSSLTSIIIPENVTNIGFRAAQGCNSLTSVTLPKSLQTIGSLAFAGNSKLLDVYCYAEILPLTESNAFNDSPLRRAALHVPASALDTYKNTAPWNGFGTIVPLTDEEMGIDKSEITNENRGIVYDLHGRRVENHGKGIYIIGGKKVVVK